MAAGIFGLLLAVLACGDSEGLPQGTPSTTSPGGGGEGPLPYASPIARATGAFPVPAYDPANSERNKSIVDVQRSLPPFSGDIAGFRLYLMGDTPRKWPCEDAEATTNDDTPAEKMPFAVSYFTPGTVEEVRPYLRTCPDGAVYYAFRTFHVGPAQYTVSLTGGERAILNDEWKVGHVKESVVHGQEAVVVEPWHPDGYGSSMVAWPAANGFLMVRANALPVQEVLKIAEGVTCPGC